MTYKMVTNSIELLAEVKRVAAENPDFRYVPEGKGGMYQCSYIGPPTPQTGFSLPRDVGHNSPCIIGKALMNLNNGDEILSSPVAVSVTSLYSGWRDRDMLTPAEDAALTKLEGIQIYQDYGLTWGESVSRAESDYSNNSVEENDAND